MNNNHDIDHIFAEIPVGSIRGNLLQWWHHNKRQFPWRETYDPYKLLVAEILLHRTRANQVVPLYELFLEHFPNIKTLAQSSSEELIALLHSGGLQWRWKLLHDMAVELETNFQGQIPYDFKILISLPGISHYIASAIRCFAFGYPEAILDTNTIRVAGRLLELKVTDSSRRSKLFKQVLDRLIDKVYPREFNFALIDFAALICKSTKPLHEECCIKQYCHSYKIHSFT